MTQLKDDFPYHAPWFMEIRTKTPVEADAALVFALGTPVAPLLASPGFATSSRSLNQTLSTLFITHLIVISRSSLRDAIVRVVRIGVA